MSDSPQGTPPTGNGTPRMTVRPIIRRQVKAPVPTSEVLSPSTSTPPSPAPVVPKLPTTNSPTTPETPVNGALPSPRGTSDGTSKPQILRKKTLGQNTLPPVQNGSTSPTSGSPKPTPPSVSDKPISLRQKLIPLDGESDAPASPRFQARKSVGRDSPIDPVPQEGNEKSGPPSVRVKRRSVGMKEALNALPEESSGSPPTPTGSKAPHTKYKKKEGTTHINVGGVKIEMPMAKRPATSTGNATPSPATISDNVFQDQKSTSDTGSSSEEVTEPDETSTDDHDELSEDVAEKQILTPAVQRLVESSNLRPKQIGSPRKESSSVSLTRARRVSEANLVSENPLRFMPEEVDPSYTLPESDILEVYGIRRLKREEDGLIKDNMTNVFIDEEEQDETLVDFIHNIRMNGDAPIAYRHFERNPLYNEQKARPINLDTCFTLEDTVRYNEVVLSIIDAGLDPNNYITFKQEWDNTQNDKLSAQQRNAVLQRKTRESRRYSLAVAAVLQRTSIYLGTNPDIVPTGKQQNDLHSLATCSPSWKQQLKNKRPTAEAGLNARCAYQPEWQTQLQRRRIATQLANRA